MTEAEPTLPDEEQPSMAQLLEEQQYAPLRRGEIRRGVVISITPNFVVLDIRAKREGFVPQREVERLDRHLQEQIAIGAEFPVYVVTPEDEEGRTIVSIARGLVQADWDLAMKLLESQEIWEGTVSGYNRGGLLVDFGRIRGFIPTSHLTGFPRSLSPEEKHKRLMEMAGRRLGLRVIEVDQQRNRLVLSERAAYREWREQQQERFLDHVQEDQIVHGRVSSVQDFGAFVDLGGVEGLIHISELSWTRVDHPSEVLKPGDEVDVRVIRVDRERKRVSLSLRQTGGDPWEHIEERYTLGQLVNGRVTRIVSYGAFVEVEPGVEGLVHISELTEDKPGNAKDVIEEGEVLPLRVVRIDATRRRLGLSFRRVTEAEWAEWRASRLHTEEKPEAPAEEAPAAAAGEAPVEEAPAAATAEAPAEETPAAAIAEAPAEEAPAEPSAAAPAEETIPPEEPVKKARKPRKKEG